MKKKMLSLVLALAMTVGVLGGCGGKGSSTDMGSDSATETDSAETTDDAASDDAEDTEAGDGVEKEAPAADGDFSDVKVGVCIFQFANNFMTLFRTELMDYLVEQGFSADNISIVDGANDQATQTNQIQNFISDGVDVLIINPVNSSSAPAITDMVSGAGIPLVYINREPDADEEARWEDNGWKITYVGCDARQSGTYQGEIISDLGLDTVDLNGNGKVDYIMVEGDPENVDSQYRTEYSIKALEDAGMEVNEIDDQVGDWDRALARQIVSEDLSERGDEIEVVFCNNDAMALGALEAIRAANRTVGKDIFLVGVDALEEALEDIMDGQMTGTVYNDHIVQADSAADAAISFVKGEDNPYYIGCDYQKVTAENAEEILDIVKQ